MQPRLGPPGGAPSEPPLLVVSRRRRLCQRTGRRGWGQLEAEGASFGNKQAGEEMEMELRSCRRQLRDQPLEEVKPSLMIGRELGQNESWLQPQPPSVDWSSSSERPKLFLLLPMLFSFSFATDRTGSSPFKSRISKHDCDPASAAASSPSSSSSPAPNDPRWPTQKTQLKHRPSLSSSSTTASPSSHLRSHRGARSKLEPLVRLFIFVLLVYELHLASVEWSGQQRLAPRPLPQLERQQHRFALELHNQPKEEEEEEEKEKEAPDCVSQDLLGLHRQPSLNKLINWPRPPVQRCNWRQPPIVLRSMVVSLFAFPLCRANELVGQLSGDKDKEPAKLPFAIESDSSSPSSSSSPPPPPLPFPLPSAAGLETGMPTMKTTPVVGVGANGTTYEETGLAQAEMPINLVAEGAPTAVAGAAETTGSYSPGPRPMAAAEQGQQQRQLEAGGVGGGQNNSNNNNNNETANRNPQPGKVVVFATAGGASVTSSPSPSSSSPSSSSSLLSLADAESTSLPLQLQQQQQLQTTGPKTGSHAQAFDPNSAAAIAKTESEPVDARDAPTKTRRKPTKEGANLTMTMERLGLAKKMRQRHQQKQQQQQQQQQRLTMTSKQPTRMGKDSSSRSLVALEEKSAAMSSVVCNSRCQCVQLEFVTDDELASRTGEPDRSATDGVGSGGGAKLKANCKSQPGGKTITRPANATTTSPASASSVSESNVNATDDDDDAILAQNQTQCDASGSESSGNRIALIEFSQDYSFDDELEAPADLEAAGLPEDELAEGGAKSDQQTTTTIPTRKTAQPPQPGNGPQNQQPASASRTSGQQHQAASSAAASSSLSSSLSLLLSASSSSSWLGADRSPVGPGAAKATTTIKQTGDDQSKDVNVSSASGPAPGGPPALRLMLSIKDNKTGTGATNGGAGTDSQAPSSLASSSRAGNEESQVRVTTSTTAPLGAEQHSTDKDSGLSTQLSPGAGPKRSSQLQLQPEPASAGNFYPFLGDHHHLHQRHHLADHQMGPSVAGLPSASFMVEPGQVDLGVRRQRKGNAGEHHQDGERGFIDSQTERPIKRIVPLRSRSLIAAGGTRDSLLESANDLVGLLGDIKKDKIQSVSLRSSRLKFELWTEIYALLAIDMRQNLFHLDLAHNDLVKLGVTFTGYIEHHLAYQLLVHNNQSWPFPSQHQSTPQQTLPLANTTQQQQHLGNNYPNLIQLQQAQQSLSSPQSTSTSSTTTTATSTSTTLGLGGLAPDSPNRRAQLRHPNLGHGRLFNAVRSRLPVDISSLILHLNQKGNTGTHINQTASATSTPSNTNTVHSSLANHPMLRSRLQQSPTVLHQPSRIRALDLSHNKLRWLINDQFRILKHVESIRLDHNQIRFIHQLAFNGLESLKYLNLNYNKIQTIYMEQFQTNYNLLALFMRSNYLSFLRAGSFASLNQLKRLDLSKNRFTFLSNNAFVGLDSLKLLNLSSNQFVHVPSTSFHSLAAKLKTLDLSRNLLAQLMPGTFFHLKLERLLLDNNDQLVAIDRGAFWDLPYLNYLSLSSSQVLISINSQAFVGVPNLETINYEDCQLLDADTKQMLDNITTSTTLRQLKQQQQQQQQHGTPNGAAAAATQTDNDDSDNDDRLVPIGSNAPSGMIGPMKLTTGAALNGRQAAMLAAASQLDRASPMVPGGAGNELDMGTGPSTRWLMKYVYSAACVMFVVIALKLVFKYTSTRHYLNMRHRRRRVYQSSSSSASSPSSCSSSAPSGSLSGPDHGHHDSGIVGGGGEDNRSEASLEFGASVSVDSLDEKRTDSPVSGGAGGDSFMMRELQPHNVIVGTASDQLGGETSQHQAGQQHDTSVAPDESAPAPDETGVVVVDSCQDDSELRGEFQVEHHEPFMGCFDCCNQQCGSEMGLVHANICTNNSIQQLNENDPTNSSSSLHVADDDGTLRGHDLAFEIINGQQQLLDQSQVCDNLTSTNLENAQIELGEIHRLESTSLEDHLMMTSQIPNSAGQLQSAIVPNDGNNSGGTCEQQHQQHLAAAITGTSEHLEQMHQSPNDGSNNNGRQPAGPLYGSFRTHTCQVNQQWSDQTDCRLFHCACLRCGGPELVGVNGYI